MTGSAGVLDRAAVGPPREPSRPAEPLAVTAALRRAIPHLHAFFPGHALTAPRDAPAGARRLAVDAPAQRGPAVHATESIWRAPAFGRRRAPVALVAGRTADPVAEAIAGPAPGAAARAATRTLMAALRDARVGGVPGLPDPGPAGLGLPWGEFVVVLDPCRPALAAAARAMLTAARATADGRPLLLAASPDAPPGAGPVLEGAQLEGAQLKGAHALPGRLAPWTLLDLAHAVHGLGDPVGLLALAAGVASRCHAAASWTSREPDAVFACVIAATRCADPFLGRPWGLEQAIRQLADWRVAEAANRRIVACTGIEWFKHRRIRAALAGADGPPPVFARGSVAIRAAAEAGGVVAVWSAAMPATLPARAATAGVPLVQVEDGFIRSAGLGVLLAPAASLVLDGRGIHYDPATGSDLEHLLAHTAFDAPLLARAARLRHALIAGQVTKYNLGGNDPGSLGPRLAAPPGRRTILVPGQVEDDAALRRGGGGIRSNLGLLRAVRQGNPDAWVVYKPHPDVEAGMRTGAIPQAAAAALADQVLHRAPIAAVYAQVQEVHVMSSLAGFEALLRGLRVVTHGQPFYAGWGLTEDHDPPPRRGRRLSLDALVAAALILHPRYLDPVTGLPCSPEVLLHRLATAAVPPAPRVPAALRGAIGGASRFLAGWWAAR